MHSGNRYLRSFPNTPANNAWADAYQAKFKEFALNWSWENAAGINFIMTAMKKANSSDGKKIAEVMRGLKIDSPFGADGTLTMRADDQTLVNYAIGYGSLTNKEPFMTNQVNGSWAQIYQLEAEWKKRKGWA